jgi:hypothetical protein
VRVKKRWGILAAALLLGGLASSQTNQQVAVQIAVQIDDTGVVIQAHQKRHVRNGQELRWGRAATGAAWFVRFAESPCANGVKEFGSGAGDPKTCVIAVQCAKAGDAGCKTYHYVSSIGRNQQSHDPDVLVDY